MMVGIDVGGTKTHLLFSDDGMEYETVVPSATWRVNGLLSDPENAHRLSALVLREVGTPRQTPLVVGAHGCDTAEQCEMFLQWLKRDYPGPIRVLNDAELLAPAAGVPNAICLIVGTGSIVVGRTADNSPIVAGGYGALLGDPGSAPALAREAIRKVLLAVDSGREGDHLQTILMTHFGVADASSLAYTFTAVPDASSWGTLAPMIFEAAERGSDLASAAIEEACQELASSVHHVRRRGAIGNVVVCAGGVITNQPLMWQVVRRHIRARDPDVDVRLLTDPPVRGALVLAEEMIDQPNHTGPAAPIPLNSEASAGSGR